MLLPFSFPGFHGPRKQRDHGEVRFSSRLRAGDFVRVRSREEILSTLDESGRLDGMPFMPEMLAYCGTTQRVFKRAHKSCDTIYQRGNRKIERTVLLETRCDGSSHGGCEAACALFWKEAWLEPFTDSVPVQERRNASVTTRVPGCTVEQLVAAAQTGGDPEKGPRYACQATEFLNFTQPLNRFDLRQYIEDYRSGNVGLMTMFHGAVYRAGAFIVRRAERIGRRVGLGDALARPLMASYDALQKLLPGGVPFPRRRGTIPIGQPTPDVGIGQLGPGSRVRTRSYCGILATLDGNNKTRGLYFDAEHVPYCGKEFTVRSLVNRVIDERTGYMLRFRTPSIILQNAYCQGSRSDGRMFCPRAIYPYWRAAWLTPLAQTDAPRASGDQVRSPGNAPGP